MEDSDATEPSKKSTRIHENTNETYIIIPPDGGWGWLVVFGAFVSYFIADGLQYSYGVFLNDMASTFGCTTSQVAMAGAISTCTFCVTGPFSAALVNRYGYRIISITGAIMASLSCALTSFSHNIYFVIGYHGVIGGMGFGMIYITALIAVGFYFERWRGLATGISVCGSGMGGIVLPPLITIIMREVGWRHTFQILSGCTLLIILCGLLFRPLKPTRIILANPRPSRSEESQRSKKTSHVSFYEKYQNRNFNTLIDSVHNQSSEAIFTTTYTTVESPNHSGLRSTRSESNYSRATKASKRQCCCCTCGPRDVRIWRSRPIYRDDIFFTGSLATVPEYRSTQQTIPSRPLLNYQLSVTRMPAHPGGRVPFCSRKCCPTAVKRTLATMLDFRMMRSCKFQLLILNAIFVSMGVYIPYMYIKDQAMQHGSDEDASAWLISTIGITNTLGRIVCGLLSGSRHINSNAMCYSFLFIGGVATLASTFSYVLWVQFVYCGIYGLSLSSISALRTLIIVQMVGLENLTNAIGIILLFQGVASFSGLAIGGLLWDTLRDYKYAFYFCGVCLCISALFLLLLHVKERKEVKRQPEITPMPSPKSMIDPSRSA